MDKNLDKKLLKVGALLIILAFALFNFNVMKSGFAFAFKLVAPFLLGVLIAMFISVPLGFIETIFKKYVFKNKESNLIRPFALLLALLILFAVGFFLFSSVIPELAKTIVKFIDKLPDFIDQLVTWGEKVAGSNSEIVSTVAKELVKFSESIKKFVPNSLKSILVGSFNIVTNTLSFFLTIFLGLCFAIYALFYKEILGDQASRFLKAFFNNDLAESLIISAKRAILIFKNFISGTFKEAVIFGLMNFAGMIVLRLPYKTTLSALAAFMTFVPYFGAFFSTFIGFILIGAESLKSGLIFFIMAIVLQQVESNIIYPRVVGDQVGLPGIWVMVAVTIGGSLAGLVGMLLAVPIATLIYFTLGDLVTYKSIRKNSKNDVFLSDIMKKSFGSEKAESKK